MRSGLGLGLSVRVRVRARARVGVRADLEQVVTLGRLARERA